MAREQHCRDGRIWSGLQVVNKSYPPVLMLSLAQISCQFIDPRSTETSPLGPVHPGVVELPGSTRAPFLPHTSTCSTSLVISTSPSRNHYGRRTPVGLGRRFLPNRPSKTGGSVSLTPRVGEIEGPTPRVGTYP
jgi:hypothetical protein